MCVCVSLSIYMCMYVCVYIYIYIHITYIHSGGRASGTARDEVNKTFETKYTKGNKFAYVNRALQKRLTSGSEK